MGQLTPQFGMLAFGGLSLAFLIRYLLAGMRFWGWLFPVTIFAALAGMVWLAKSQNYHEDAIAAPFFGAIAIPFLVAFAIDFRKTGGRSFQLSRSSCSAGWLFLVTGCRGK